MAIKIQNHIWQVRSMLLVGKRGLVRRVAAVVLAFFVSHVSLPAVGVPRAEAAWSDVDGTALRKESEVILEDDQLLNKEKETLMKANVLIMMEATAGMQFSPTTVMPAVVLSGGKFGSGGNFWTESEKDGADWTRTRSVYGKTVEDIINMTAGATFGIGAMPVAWSGQNLNERRNLYGRERDLTNNYPAKGTASNFEDFKELYKDLMEVIGNKTLRQEEAERVTAEHDKREKNRFVNLLSSVRSSGGSPWSLI